MKKTMLTLCIALLGFSGGMLGCANVVTVKETYTSDGQKGYVIDCSGDSDYHLIMHNPTQADCYTKAGEICGVKGYEILNQGDKEQASLSGAVSTTKASTAFGVEKIFRTMVIKCKD